MKATLFAFSLALALATISCRSATPLSEWDLNNAPRGTCLSLQIAAYEGYEERQNDAIDAVRKLRGRGIEAYYYNGEAISSVCIGAWPTNAIKLPKRDSDTDPANSIIPGLPTTRLEAEPTPKLEVLDPTLAKAFRNFPYHSLNGGKTKHPSFIVYIPHDKCLDLPTFSTESPTLAGKE